MAATTGLFTSWRQRLSVGIATVVLALGSLAAWWAFSSPPLSVILITFDTTRADRLGAYGYQNGLTDEFDQLAKQGVLFENAYAPVPLTLPSHASMLTGLYPPEHGLRVNGSGRLGDNVPTLPAILKQHGYDTGAFVAAFVLNSKFGLNRGFDVYDDDLSDSEPGEHSFDRRRKGELVVDSALQWLKLRTSKPFFCWIHLYDAHAVYDKREALFGSKFEQQPYDAGIAVEVQQLSRVLAYLKERKLSENTIVVVAGDHGEGLGEHGEEEHGQLLYNTTIRVPLVVANPWKSVPGLRTATPVSLVDLTPTLLDSLGIRIPKEMSGRSFKKGMTGENLPSRPCYAETEAPFLDNRWCPMQAVMTDRWKYIHTTRAELFDLTNDPGETKNLLETEPEQRKELQAILEEMQERFVPLGVGNVQLSDKDRQILASLGYVAGTVAKDANELPTETLPDMKDMLPFTMKIDLVHRLMADGEPDEAVNLAREVVAATTPHYPMAEVALGDALQLQGHLDEAAEHYRAALVSQPDCAVAHNRLGKIDVAQGRLEQALDEFRSVIRLQSEASQAHFDLAQTLLRLQRVDEAMFSYKEAIRSDPGFVKAHFQLGMLYAKDGRPNESVTHFEQSLKFDPRLTMAHVNLSSVLLQLRRIGDSVAHARKAVELDPELFDSRFMLGAALAASDRIEEAIAEFREAQRLRPDDRRPLARIIELSARKRR